MLPRPWQATVALAGDFLLSLLNAAQVKLGGETPAADRRDRRGARAHAAPCLPGELTRQIDQVLGQLQMSQVSAESRASQQGQPEENDIDRAPAPPPTGAAQ
jgi:hypothetical protein